MQNGVLLYVDGQLSSPEEILIRHCVQEEGHYMADYVLDEEGKLIELRYDRIRNL